MYFVLIIQLSITSSNKISADKSAKNLTCCLKFCPPKNFARVKKKHIQFFSVDKNVEISSWCRKYCPPKNFLRRKFCPIGYVADRYVKKHYHNHFCYRYVTKHLKILIEQEREKEIPLCYGHLSVANIKLRKYKEAKINCELQIESG